MSSVKEQYEAYPYPERDPKDEKRRLITGSPSHPLEMDQFLWNGKRDWTKPLKALVAGGGTGDGLIQLAQVLTGARRPYQITYIDLSTASRAIAEERARMRGLKNITFLTGSLLDAPELGPFDYIDCCGVLHHLPEPQAGFDALGRALAPEGGLGFMVYAPYGRSGVYPLQDAFARLLAGLPPKQRLREGRRILANLPKNHPFAQNRVVGDHKRSDAGFYDLLLHSTDRPYRVGEVVQALDHAGLRLAGFTSPALYDPSDLTGEMPLPEDPVARMSLAEELRGTIRMHTGYAVPKPRAETVADGHDLSQVPHLKGVAAAPLAREIEKRGQIKIKTEGAQVTLKLDKAIAPLVAGMNGRTPLAQLGKRAGIDPIAMAALWYPASTALLRHGLIHYSRLLC
ncbi:class I SAM-dependent methyltransferase [Aliiroseovarius sp.]|uniref:class I SAM-dependent methyltransferase n=1 Tax=Aliiroseovarius sp. TaxID=1872442 RepID=UPI00262B6147|nr:class I SAM-dependent methyltransferase [Aliiroseovarius sp.]